MQRRLCVCTLYPSPPLRDKTCPGVPGGEGEGEGDGRAVLQVQKGAADAWGGRGLAAAPVGAALFIVRENHKALN